MMPPIPWKGRAWPVWSLLAAALSACTAADGALPPDAGPVRTVEAGGVSNPTVALDPGGGHGYVAWVGTEERVSNVYLSVVRREGHSAPVRVNDLAGDAAAHEQAPAQVAVGPEGNVYVLWQNNTEVADRRFPASDLRLAVSTDGGRTFAPAITVNDDAGGPPSSHTFHDLAVAPDGAVYVSWIDSRVRDAMRASRPGERHGGHGGGGHGGDLPGPEIRVARSTDGGRTFGSSVVVDAGACPCCRTSLAIAPDGGVYLAWRKEFAGDVRDVVVSRAEPGALAFSEPVRVHADDWAFPGCPHAGPSIVVGGAGRMHVAWYTGRDGRQGLWHAVSDDAGRSFGSPGALLTDAWVPPSGVELATAGGEVWAVWDDRRREDSVRRLAFLQPSGSWRTVSAPAPARSPSLAGGSGGALSGWIHGDSVRVQWIDPR